MPEIEIAFGTREAQRLMKLSVPEGTTIADVVRISQLPALFPAVNFEELSKGIWSEPRPDDHVVGQGDRVEIYRPLEMDPKTARRKRAENSSQGTSD